MTKGKPSILLCKTFKGKDFGVDIENLMNWHGKSLGNKSADVVRNLRKKLLFPKFEPKIWVIHKHLSYHLYDIAANKIFAHTADCSLKQSEQKIPRSFSLSACTVAIGGSKSVE